jgi:hypothetical protein
MNAYRVFAVHGGELTRTREIFHNVFRRPAWQFECRQFSFQLASSMAQRRLLCGVRHDSVCRGEEHSDEAIPVMAGGEDVYG